MSETEEYLAESKYLVAFWDYLDAQGLLALMPDDNIGMQRGLWVRQFIIERREKRERQ